MKEEEIRKRGAFNKYLTLVEEDSRVFFKTEEFLLINCPACGSTKYTGQFKKSIFSYVICNDCDTLFVNPRPAAKNIKEFYSNSPSSKFWVEEFFKPVAEARREKIFKPRADYVVNCFPEMRNKAIADVGAGFGLFLEELNKISPGNRIIAIEPSPEMANICRSKGFEVITDLLENLSEKHNNFFYLVTAFELFEHITDPNKFLSKVFSILQPGGYFLFTTLNGEGFDIQVLWERSKSVSPPHHLNFFNPSAIKIILEKIGFVVAEVSTPGQLDWDIVESSCRNEHVDIGRFWKMLSQKGGQKEKDALQDWIAVSGFSSHMRVLARKPE